MSRDKRAVEWTTITLNSSTQLASHYEYYLLVTVLLPVYRLLAAMAEPIPSASTAVDAADEENQPIANNAEDRKAAAALNNLNTQAISQDGESTTKQPSAADQEALSKAISQLEIASGSNSKKTEASKKVEEKRKEEAEVKKKIKVSQEDVNFLVSLHGRWRSRGI